MMLWISPLQKRIVALKPALRTRWKPLLQIFACLLCLLASKFPYWGNLELAAKTESNALNVTLAEPWIWQDSVKLTATDIRIDNVLISDNPFVEASPVFDPNTSTRVRGSISLSTEGGQWFLSYLQIPADRRINITSPNQGYLDLSINTAVSIQPVSVSGKITLVGAGKVCQAPAGGESVCHAITPSAIRPDAPKAIYFSSADQQFRLSLPLDRLPIFTSQLIADMGFWELGVAKSFEHSSFECSLMDGVLVFTVENQSLDLWRTECISISGSALNVNASWADGRVQARIKGEGHTNLSLMPSALQALFIKPWLSDIATAMAWIIGVFSAMYLLLQRRSANPC